MGSEQANGPSVDRSVSLGRANTLALVISTPMVVVLSALYAWLQPDAPLFEPLVNLPDLLSLLLAVLFAVALHEAAHALGWAAFGRVPFRRVRFGLASRTLNAYAHLLDPIPARAYRWGTAIPGLLLGLLPCIAALAAGSAWWMLFGLTLTLAAGGEMLVLWLLRGAAPQALVLDYPSRAGCLVIAGHRLPPSAPQCG